MEKKIDITSTVLEKGFDAAKNFLDKLIMPAVEETGLLIKEPATLFRFKNQIRMLNKAKTLCEKNNISPKTISFKLLCPLLDYSGIEEDEVLQDKWAILLANMVDSEQNIENHVFPYILSQLSKNEFLFLEKVFEEKQTRILKLTQELEQYLKEKPKVEEDSKNRIDEIERKIVMEKQKSKSPYSTEIWNLEKEKREVEDQIKSFKHTESLIKYKLKKPEVIPADYLKEFELSNLIRLGLVKEEKDFFAHSQTLEIPNDREYESRYINVDLDIDVESNVENILTELGELFIHACKEKATNSK